MSRGEERTGSAARGFLRWRTLIACALSACAGGGESTLVNPTARSYPDEVVRLLAEAPMGPFAVSEDGAPVPYQVEESDGKRWIWVCSSFAPGQAHRYAIVAGAPTVAKPKVKLQRDGDRFILDNGLIAVRLPAATAAGGAIPGPISGVRLPGGGWIGGSSWVAAADPSAFAAAVIGDGTVLAKVRLSYRFPGTAGLLSEVDSFAEVEVTLAPG